MVVMLVWNLFVAGAAVAEIMAFENARLFEQAYGAIDGGDRDARIDLVGAFVHHLDIGVIVRV